MSSLQVDAGAPSAIDEAAERWEELTLRPFMERRPERREVFRTLGGTALERLYTPQSQSDHDYVPTRASPASIRSRAGRIRRCIARSRGRCARSRVSEPPKTRTPASDILIAQGQTGISTDFDMPTLMGYDSDDPRSEGEVGREGVAVDTVDDMLDLYRDIDLEKISVSMTINPTAWILLAMYLVVAEERGFDWQQTLRDDAERHHQRVHLAKRVDVPAAPRDANRARHDRVRRAASAALQPGQRQRLPHARSGKHRVQEVAFTLAAGIAYVEEVAQARDRRSTSFAPRLSFYFVSQIDFLEEVAKFRAARRVWARVMKERFGAKKSESMRLRFHCQTAGASCTAREPLNNIARTAIEALAAVLGGAQSLHTNGYDEALSIPSEPAMKIALRTQQIIAEETGVAGTIDPLAGSYAIESSDRTRSSRLVASTSPRSTSAAASSRCIEDNYFQIGDRAMPRTTSRAQGAPRMRNRRSHEVPRRQSPNPRSSCTTSTKRPRQRQLAAPEPRRARAATSRRRRGAGRTRARREDRRELDAGDDRSGARARDRRRDRQCA